MELTKDALLVGSMSMSTALVSEMDARLLREELRLLRDRLRLFWPRECLAKRSSTASFTDSVEALLRKASFALLVFSAVADVVEARLSLDAASEVLLRYKLRLLAYERLLRERPWESPFSQCPFRLVVDLFNSVLATESGGLPSREVTDRLRSFLWFTESEESLGEGSLGD
jgi:hypothetical protein